MSSGSSYSATSGDALFEKRTVHLYCKETVASAQLRENRTFIPFRGFDGQSLAGSGALVFEGELLGG